MLIRHAILLLIFAATTTGCDRLSGVAEQKIYDAEAVGYACRVSLKTPEACMKENETQSPSSVLTGWKAADKDITDRKLDPSMRGNPVGIEQAASAPASAPVATDELKPGDEDASSEKEPVQPKTEKKPAQSH